MSVTRDYVLVLGSNSAPARHLRLACARLHARFDVVAATPALRTRDAGGARYLNAAMRIRSDLAHDALREALHAIEDEAGRERGGAAVTLDIDVVASIGGDGRLQVIRPDDLSRGYVRALLARIGLVD